LQRQTNGSGTLTGFTRAYANGTIDSYSFIPTNVSLPDGNVPAFLTSRADPFGRTTLSLTYHETSFGIVGYVVQLTSVTDGCASDHIVREI
jgi:hypothetical protein